jgi:glycosyltransferase involved in cell wall biosynthesis
MRIGENPTKVANAAFKVPENLAVATVTYIPFLAGYWEQSLDVLKVCITSLRTNTQVPFDLMVFDNGSCPEVVNYLLQLRESDWLQYLILSKENIGKIGAQNFLFSAAASGYVAYTDSDVYFYSGWFEEEMRVLEAFPNVGMVSGLPTLHNFPYAPWDQSPDWLGRYTKSTMRLAQADPETKLERGRFMNERWIEEYSMSIGRTAEEYLSEVGNREQILLTRRGVRAYVAATHFHFLARSNVLKTLLPLPVLPGLKDYVLDEALDSRGYMRLSVDGYVVHHLGNVLTDGWQSKMHELDPWKTPASEPRGRRHSIKNLGRLLTRLPLVQRILARLTKLWRKLLVRVYRQVFNLLYNRPSR